MFIPLVQSRSQPDEGLRDRAFVTEIPPGGERRPPQGLRVLQPIQGETTRRPRFDRTTLEVAAQVGRERVDSRIPAVRFEGQGSRQDGVQIAAQAAGANLPDRARQLSTCRRRRRRGLAARRGRHRGRSAATGLVRESPGQELVEHHAERVDVGRGRGLLAAELLG